MASSAENPSFRAGILLMKLLRFSWRMFAAGRIFVSQYLLLCFLFIVAFVSRFLKKELYVFGSTPIINNKYWSKSLKEKYKTVTIMSGYYDSINNKCDYDKYFVDFIPKKMRFIKSLTGKYISFIYLLIKAKILHTSFDGFSLKDTFIEKFEPILLKIANVKIIILPYGGDCYVYSYVNDLLLRNALIGQYPHTYEKEREIKTRVTRWLKFCDIFLSGAQTDMMFAWSVTPFNMLCVDLNNIKIQEKYLNSAIPNQQKVVKIIHFINHRFIKGSEFVVEAVKSLKEEGCSIELILLEKVQNSRILEALEEADICADQFLLGYYGLAAVEAMAKGIPVLCNLNSGYSNLGRAHSFLNECPIVSTTPENIKENLRVLIENPELREELGKAGRQYAEKYHSYKTSQYMFGAIYDKIIHDKDIDLMNLFHPILSEYNKSMPFVKHPLINGQIPQKYFKGKL